MTFLYRREEKSHRYCAMLGFYLLRIQYYQGVGVTYFSITNIFFADHLFISVLVIFLHSVE